MFEIVVDSAASIPAVVAQKYGINVISFENLIDGEKFVCYDPTLSVAEELDKAKVYYSAMREELDIKTGLISIGEFERYFDGIIKENKDIIYFSLSKNISGTYNSARLAASEVMEKNNNGRKIYIIDSLNACLGQGLLAIYASELRTAGLSLKEIVPIIEEYLKRMNGVFTVETLSYLKKSGRVSGSTAAIGNALNIKPILKGSKDGVIVNVKKCRGRKLSLNALITLLCDNIVDSEQQIIGIAHADAEEEANYVASEIKKRIEVRDILITTFDFCTGSHAGPGTISVFFMGEDRELSGAVAENSRLVS